MNISGIDITLNRINQIESSFKTLVSPEVRQKASEFTSVLDEKIKSTKDISKSDINELVSKYSKENGLDESLIKAVVKAESNYKTDAISKAGAQGLMQLMPSTAQELGVKNALDAEDNIKGGTKYLKSLLNKYEGNKQLALAAYNAGPGNVQKYGGVPPFKETQNYVNKVIELQNRI